MNAGTDLTTERTGDPTLRKFRERLSWLYGKKLDRAVLLKSTKSAVSDSPFHYEVAVFLTPSFDRQVELNRVADLATDILYEDGRVVHALVYSAEHYGECTPLMKRVRMEGVEF